MTRPHQLAVLLTALALPGVTLAHPDQVAATNIDAPAAAEILDIEPSVTIVVADGVRTITSNGIPNHPVGRFPGPGNPNTIRPQEQSFNMTTDPQPAEARQAQRGGRPPRPALFGVAVNGVVMDPGTAEIWRDGRDVRGGPPQPGDQRYEAISDNGPNLGLDANNAHVQPTGTYHYHGLPTGLIETLGGRGDAMLLIGWAADGYPIYAPWSHQDADDADSPLVDLESSYQLKDGPRPDGAPAGDYDGTFTDDYAFVEGSGDLDRFGGRDGVTPEFPDGTYYYVITEDFPFIPREHYGTPDPSFSKGGGPGGPGGERRGVRRGGERGPRPGGRR